ncbi:hypothetical protein HY969_02725 [Candidatus Kaiserbacteria bacterium]|nr:hypothetical protein [Candidatus Kaiserbacteria bacterium]
MQKKYIEIALLVFLAAGSRLVPHLPNMTAVGAVALKARARYGPMGLGIPVLGMLLSDIALGFYDLRLLTSVYASFALSGSLGVFLKNISLPRLALIPAIGSTIFFLSTNTAVWALSAWYPHTLSGLLACLVAGLPFYCYMLAGDTLFTSFVFAPSLLEKSLTVGTILQARSAPMRQ